ncbi:MAG: stage V sporulation protein D [Candidatus Dojkabacteria bacterium]|nr:MAG: stage V sporulation protein D [Candidatus Dojkabacteria bacterium]
MKANNISKINKIYFVSFIFSLILLLASFKWQVLDASKFKEIQESRIYVSEIESLRGTIYARDGSTLAFSEPRFDVYIWMEDLLFFEDKGLQTRDDFVNQVAPIIDLTPENLKKIIKENYEENNILWFKIADGIPAEKWEKLNNLRSNSNKEYILNGLRFDYTSTRNYPEGYLASQVIGLTTKYKDNVIGVGGLEGYWDKILNPVKGFLIKESDVNGQAISSALLPTIEPKNGSSIYISIDKYLQKVAEEKIKWGVEKYEAKAGTIVIMDPKTGEILALANWPSYDPNVRENNPDVYGNIAITEPYEVGSIGKVLTLAAALDNETVKPDTVILENGHNGCEEISRDLKPVCTWDKKPKPPMPVSECLITSDNLCFYHLADKMNNEDFYNYLRDFGIGSPTGIDLQGESYGELKNFSQWNVGDISAFSYGHGYLVNAVQITEAVATVANDGVRMKPHLVTKIVDSQGNVKIFQPEIVDSNVISKKTADELKVIMNEFYNRSILSSEYYYQHLKNYNIAAKSGTGLIATNTGYSDRINASYIGFDASDRKAFIMLVRLEDPNLPEYPRLAFHNARIVWMETFNAIREYLDVPTK